MEDYCSDEPVANSLVTILVREVVPTRLSARAIVKDVRQRGVK